MKIPKRLDIKGKEYKIKLKRNLKEGGDRCDGLIDFESRVISIESGLSPDDRLKAFMHEVFHGILHELGMGVTSLHEDVEHVIIENLANYVVDTFISGD